MLLHFFVIVTARGLHSKSAVQNYNTFVNYAIFLLFFCLFNEKIDIFATFSSKTTIIHTKPKQILLQSVKSVENYNSSLPVLL